MEELWRKLRDKGLYTKSFEEFKEQYDNPEGVTKLHTGLVDKSLYTKSEDDFATQYGFTPATATTVSDTESQDVSDFRATDAAVDDAYWVNIESQYGVGRDAFSDLTRDQLGTVTGNPELDLEIYNKHVKEESTKRVISDSGDKRREDPVNVKQGEINDYWGESDFNRDDYTTNEDGSYSYQGQLVASDDPVHGKSIQAITKQNQVDSTIETRARARGSAEMPAITAELLDYDDNKALDKLNEKWLQYGFEFSQSALDFRDQITVKADNGEEETFAFDAFFGRDSSEAARMDTWMRERAIDQESMLQAHLANVGPTREERAEFNVNNTETYNRSTAPLTRGDGSQVDPPQVGSWEYENEFLPSLRVNGMDTQFETAMRMVAEENFVNNLKHEDGTPYTEEEKRDYKMTKQDKDFLAYPSVDDPRVKEIAIGLMNDSSEAGLMEERIAESVETMDGTWFTKSDPQRILTEQGKARYAKLETKQKNTLQKAKQVGDRYTENLEQLKIAKGKLDDFDLESQIEAISNRDFKSQEEADAAQAEANALIAQYKSIYGQYQDLFSNHKALSSVSRDINSEIQDLGLELDDLGVYNQFIGRNHQLGTQMSAALANAVIDLGQGLVGVVEMAGDLAFEIGYGIGEETGHPSVGAWLDNQYGNPRSTKPGVVDKINKAIDGFQQKSLTDNIQRPQEFGSIKSSADFGEWFGVMLAGQAPNLALMYATGNASLYVMGASAAGSKYNTLREQNALFKESGGLYGVEHSFNEMFLNASLTGTAEALSEKITLGQIKAAKGTWKDLMTNAGVKGGMRNYVKTVMFNKRSLTNFGKDLFTEGGSEVVATVSENALDIMSGDKSVGLWDNVPESFVSGIAISGTIKSPTLLAHASKAFRSRGSIAQKDINLVKLEKLQKSLLEEDLSPEAESAIEDQIAELTLETTKLLETDIKRVGLLTAEEKRALLNTEADNRKLQQAFNEVAADESLSEEAKQEQMDAINDKYAKNQVAKQEILNKWAPNVVDERYEQDVAAAKLTAEAIEKAGGETINVNEGSSSEFGNFLDKFTTDKNWLKEVEEGRKVLEKVVADPNASEEQRKEARDLLDTVDNMINDRANQKFNYGIHVPVFKNGEVIGHEIFINKDTATEDGVWTTGAHEMLHAVLYNTIKRNPNVGKAMGDALIEAIESKGGTFNEELYNQKMGEYHPDKQGEETLTVLSEMLLEGQLEFNDSTWVKIGDFIRQSLSRVVGRDVKLDTADDVKKFIKDYSRSIKKGYVNKSIVNAAVKGLDGKIISEARAKENVVKEQVDDRNFSKAVGDASSVNPDLKDIFDKTLLKPDGTRFTSKEQYQRSPGYADAWTAMAYSPTLDGLINIKGRQLGVPENVLDNPKLRSEFTQRVKENLSEKFGKEFDPAKNESLFGWLTGKNPAVKFAVLNVMKDSVQNPIAGSVSLDAPMGDSGGSFADNLVGEDIDGLISTGRPAREIELEENAPKVFVETVGINAKAINEINTIVDESNINLKDLNYKGVKKLTTGKKAPLSGVLDIIAEQFGVEPKRIVSPQDLNTKQRTAAQEFIKSNVKALIEMLPEGETQSGIATGVANTKLGSLYVKGDRVKAAEGGGTAGKFAQVKKDNITVEEFSSLFGINPDGSLESKNRKFDGAIKALVNQAAMITANQAIRQSAIIEENNPLHVIALVGDGRSGAMFSKRVPKSQSAKRSVLYQTVGSIDGGLKNKGDKTVFWSGLANVVNKAVLNNSVSSIQGFISEEFSGNPEILSKSKDLAERLHSAMQPMLKRSGVKGIKTIETKAKKITDLLYAQNLSAELKVSAFTKDPIGVIHRFQNPIHKVNVDNFRAADKAYLSEQYNPSDPSSWFKEVSMLQNSSTTSPRRAQAYTDPNGKHVKFFTETLLIGSIDKKTGIVTSSVDPELKFKLKKDGGVDPKTVTHKGDSIAIDMSFAANSSRAALGDSKDPVKKAKRKNDEKFAQEFFLRRAEHFAKLYKGGDISNIEVGMFLASELSNMNSSLRRAASVKYVSEDAFDILNAGGKLKYEHMLPAVVVGLSIMDTMINGKGVKDAKRVFDQYTVQVIGQSFDDAITDAGNAETLPEGTTIDTPNVNLIRSFAKPGDPRVKRILDVDTNTWVNISEVYTEYTNLMKSNNHAQQEIDNIKLGNKAMQRVGAMFSKRAPSKGISVLDFDDTLATTKSNVLYTMPDGTTGKLSAEEFAKKGGDLLAQGVEFDFSEFNKVVEGKTAPLFNKAMKLSGKFGTENMFILTARAPESQMAIKQFLDAQGLNIPLKNITGLGKSEASAKANWIAEKIGEGYNDFYFADDALQNVEAVRDMLDAFDVKGKVQQARLDFSKRVQPVVDSLIDEGKADMDSDFNIILEEKRGVGRYKEFSPAKARKRGKNKGKFKFFIPPSADDFAGLMYAFMGKGKTGDKHHKWFKENLFDPFSKGVRMLNTVKQIVANDMKKLRKASPEVKKLLTKKVPGTEYTYQDAIRVANWVNAGFDIPGLSETDKNKLVKAVESDPKVKAFADAVSTINDKAMGVAEPGDYWLSGTLASDLTDALSNARATYLQQWKANADVIFSPKNLNKIEAVYGSNFREALEDILYRMENGGNSSRGSGRLLNNFTSWIHGSIGTTMFFNARSAVLQMISNVNFVNWSDNNMLKAAAAFANQPQYWKDVSMIFNSPFLKQRRAGLQTDVNAAELLAQIKDSKNKMKAATAYLLQLGFTPTQIADSLAIATGGATFYRNRTNTYVEQGMSQAEAETRAFEDMMELAEETQQSAREDRISQQQASPLGKFILAFQNTPMQYNRLIKKAAMDLVNGRGDAKANISRIVYYGAVQNMIFYGLQQALFAAMFGSDEEDELTDKKVERVVNGMTDTLLRGAGIGGAVISTLKNVIIKAAKEAEKMNDDKFFTDPDWGNVVIEALNLSPPIGIKARKIYSGLKTWEYNKDVIDHMEKTDLDNPIYDAVFSGTEAVTNLPLSRLYSKYQNISEAMDADHETWKRVAMLLGWNKWSFGIKNQDVMTAKNEVKEIKKEAAKEKAEMKKVAKEIERQAEDEIVEESNLLEQQEERERGEKDIKCAAVSRSGKRCGKKVKGGGNYCTIHEDVASREDGKKVQCSHVKDNGDQCKMKTTNKSGKCYYHD